MKLSKNNIYSGFDRLPKGHASDHLTKGCIVLEGGAFRGVYTSGVLDALMEEDINMQSVIGVSAGALNGVSYVSGQIGRSARANLGYRHDSRYVGGRAYMHNDGVIGFDFLFGEFNEIEPMDMKRFDDPKRRFTVVVSNLLTGEAEYPEKGKCSDMPQAIRASASMPFVSKPVELDGLPYLDGGCTDKIPFQWAIDQGYEKIIVVRTRPRDYRKPLKKRKEYSAVNYMYGKNYPDFAQALALSDIGYNKQCNAIDRLEKEGRLFVIAPSGPVNISRLEGDMEKLGDLYWMGCSDAKKDLSALRAYLGIQ